jgi:hypothetical protein
MNLDSFYTIFILNPKRPVNEHQVYGYRAGFSLEEMSFIQRQLNGTQQPAYGGPTTAAPRIAPASKAKKQKPSFESAMDLDEVKYQVSEAR